jgi:hypothetical protein
MPTSHEQDLRNKIGGILRQNPDADVSQLRRELEIHRLLKDHVREVIRSAPPLTPEQLRRLTILLHPETVAGE